MSCKVGCNQTISMMATTMTMDVNVVDARVGGGTTFRLKEDDVCQKAFHPKGW